MGPTEYQTVFELGIRSFPWEVFIIPCGLAAIGIALFRLFQRELVRVIGGLLFAFGAFLLVVLCLEVPSKFNELRHAYKSGQSSVVEGPVENFQPVRFLGPSRESFSVAGTHFSYNVGDSTACFHDAFPYRIPVRAGQFVRLYYNNGCIQRVEIRADSLSSAQERSDYAKAEKATRNQLLKRDPRTFQMNLSITFVALIVSLCWNLDWRHYIRYWLRREPPYSRSWELGLRAFFLLSFVGAAISLFQQFSDPTRTVADYKRAGLLSLIFIGFFVVVDLLVRWRFRSKQAALGSAPQPGSGE